MLGKKQEKEILEACRSPFKLRKDHSPRSIWVTPLGVAMFPSTYATGPEYANHSPQYTDLNECTAMTYTQQVHMQHVLWAPYGILLCRVK